ncbi:MAG: PD-(D/E)XK nuclease family protein [Bacteroidetes bacterium]|nr:PD-(D/E)XK nuclease family protein [Bacteroidota bacterium]
MKMFLQELAEEVHQSEVHLARVTVIFPTRRAVLYFKKYLSALIDRPVFSPRLITFEDFVSDFSSLKIPDKLELVHRLYFCYKELFGGYAEPFDQFFRWGEMLLRDFDEADRYQVDVKLLFSDLRHLKELDREMDYLSAEQKEYLKNFWNEFDERPSINQQKFIEVWTKLYPLYKLFNERLSADGLSYEGNLHREVADKLRQGEIKLDNEKQLWFAGFNALTHAEENIISFCVENAGAKVRWDYDQYYVNDERQEAGKFFNAYKKHPVLGKTFSAQVPVHFHQPKNIELLGAAQPIAQVKLLAGELEKHLLHGMVMEETILILPDEKLLMPVLYSLSPVVDKFNVSMGFPLVNAPVYNLIELLVQLQIRSNNKQFDFSSVQSVLSHPYVVAADALATHHKLKTIYQNNWVEVSDTFLTTDVKLHTCIFKTADKITRYLLAVIAELEEASLGSELDKEGLLRGKRLITRLEAVWEEPTDEPQRTNRLKSFLRLFRQYARTEKIPFIGEPLKGLPITGLLESRNLDFKNVFILSLNEGVVPPSGHGASYIPSSLRKAYNLPADEHRGAMYAYLFYRLLQRAQNIFLFYNSEPDTLGQGEMSRYVQQLIYESGWPIQPKVLHNPIASKKIEPIVIQKSETVRQTLVKLKDGSNRSKGFSPSALNTYLDCSLKFYFQYVARIREADTVQEEIDPRVLGNLLHKIMERFYVEATGGNLPKLITQNNFDNLEERINRLMDDAFRNEYSLAPTEEVVYEGQRVVVREVVRKFVKKILDWDKSQAPFQIEGLEENRWTYSVNIRQAPYTVLLGGMIDRIDMKDDQVRIIDYKTGKDKLVFKDIPSLFSGSDRNKAVFQTLLYALLYQKNASDHSKKIVPGLLNRNNLFTGDFQFGLQQNGQRLTDATPFLPEVEEHLTELLNEIFDPAKPFHQTDNKKICDLCVYRTLCYR